MTPYNNFINSKLQHQITSVFSAEKLNGNSAKQLL